MVCVTERYLNSTGAYFSTYANHVSSVQVRGAWRNVIIDGSRDEEDMKPPVDGDCGFVELANGHLQTFRIHGYGDGDESCPVLRGNGSVASGTIVSGGSGINITRGNMVDVDVLSGGTVRLVVNGSVKGSRWRSTQRHGNVIDVRCCTATSTSNPNIDFLLLCESMYVSGSDCLCLQRAAGAR